MRPAFLKTLKSAAPWLLLVAATCAPALAAAQASTPSTTPSAAWPSKTVRIIGPATPGGTSDIFARAIATRLSESLGQSVIVEYKPGASTNIGSDYVAKSPPDGYTLLINGITLATNPALYPAMPFSPTRDLAPVIEIASMPNVVTVTPVVPVSTLRELVQRAKSQPDKYNYGTPGVGSSGHLSAELLTLKTGAKFTHVAYQGNAQATADHVGGTLEVGFVNLPVALQFVKSGKLKALAITSARRSPALPDLPTVAEALGLPDYELSGWFGLLAPTGTPPAVMTRLQLACDAALKDPAVRQIILDAGGDVVGGSSGAFADVIRKDAVRLADVIKKSGATLK